MSKPRPLRVVTWNMGRKKKTHKAAWYYLLSCLKPDIACVQEALKESDEIVGDQGNVQWCRKCPAGRRTGVFVREGLAYKPIKEISLNGSYLAGVELADPSLRIFSIHVGPEAWKNQEAFAQWIVGQVDAEPSL